MTIFLESALPFSVEIVVLLTARVEVSFISKQVVQHALLTELGACKQVRVLFYVT